MVIPPRQLKPEDFLIEADKGGIVIDVRAPIEFEEDHIPGAISWPLFSDAERSEIGTLYKKKKEKAIEKGFEIIGPKMADMARYGRDLFQAQTTSHPLLIHCWRGGMRSQSVAWLLRTAGVPAIVLNGGYKAYRSYARSMYVKPLNLAILGGFTGSAKTESIRELGQIKGERIIDLEAIANHYGSAFGNLDGHPQPSSKHFSNLLFDKLRKIDAWGENPRHIWVENESRIIGQINIPEPFYTQMKSSVCFEMERTEGDRVDHLVNMYGNIDIKLLSGAFEKIKPKLGGLNASNAINSLKEGDLATAAIIALVYYDKTYSHGLKKRSAVNRTTVDCKGLNPKDCALHLSKILTNYISE